MLSNVLKEDNTMAENTTNTTENTKTEDTSTMTETINKLKAKLEAAKDAASKCDSSTLAKVGKVGLGLAVVAGAAYAGYYYGSQEANDTTTIEYK